MYSMSRDLASEVYPLFAASAVAATAGGSGDATAAPGDSIDLTALPDRFESVAFAITAKSVLAATKTMTLTAKIETSADNSTWSDLLASATVILSTGAGGGSTEKAAAIIGASLENAQRYVRVNVTPDLSATGTDTTAIASTALFGGRRKST
ncbi:MAG TPA: hypothetical protein VL358_04610 [Caulobacteraceae bacterium]|jgi:hypothetical protein|nr:hypothetical protein [Caulobacteraceae bacterium]